MSLIGIGKLEKTGSKTISQSKAAHSEVRLGVDQSRATNPTIAGEEKLDSGFAEASAGRGGIGGSHRLGWDRTGPHLEKTRAPILAETTLGQLSVDVYQTDEEIIIVAPIAGTPAEDVSITMTDDILTIKGHREITLKQKIRRENAHIQECFWGNFSRSIVLPAAVDTSRVEAHFKNNVLTITIPKTELVKTRVIRIKEE